MYKLDKKCRFWNLGAVLTSKLLIAKASDGEITNNKNISQCIISKANMW